MLEFYRKSTTVDPLNPEKASVLVSSGIYNYSRNPMYLGLVVMLVGLAIHLGNIYTLSVIPVFIGYLTVAQIIPEERIMRKKFGEEFLSYEE